MNADAYELERFVVAQEPVYGDVVDELRAGQKRSHWMWFVFPQIAGLGRSAMARHYAIASSSEAAAYLAHPLLGVRLRECTKLVLANQDRTIHEMFGSPDDQKFFSSMTLFDAVAQHGDGEPFSAALDRFFDGARDDATIAFLRR